MIRTAETAGYRSAVVRRDRRVRSGNLPVEVLGMLYFLVILGAGLILVWQPAKVTEATHEINRLEAVLKDLKLRNEDLKKTVAGMESLGYVESEARDRLEMVDPTEVRTCELVQVSPGTDPGATVASSVEPERTGIMSVLARIAQIFGGKQATAKGQR